ncbi:MAG: type IV pilus assembly protein PilM [Candidatus Moranbacteria bacterium]|nr:type IV pilus assembly protein PilM [Candidatus Moranbacteria bacterium]
MWSLFGGGKNKIVGIDIGTSGIKAVELEHSPSSQEVSLKNYVLLGFSENLPQKERERRITKEEIVGLLKVALKQSKIKTRNASFSIPAFSSFVSFVTMPRVQEEDIRKAITIEAQKFIPVSLEEVVLGWEVIDEPEGKEIANIRDQNKMKVLLLAVPRDIVARYKEIASACGLNLKNLEVEAFPLLRSLTFNFQKTFVVADIGARVCNLLVVSNGSLRGARNIGLGGEDLTEVIARSVNIAYERAEELKKNEGLFNKQVAELLIPALGNIIDELKRVIAVYRSKNPNKEIDELVLSGGTAQLRGIVELFSDRLNIPTTIGDPWKKLTIDNKIKSAIESRGTSFSIAIGLALKNE